MKSKLLQKTVGCRSFNRVVLSLIAWVAILSILSPLQAQDFPSRPVQLIVPWAAGSGNDLSARAIQPYAEKALGTPLMIENVPGADTLIGMGKLYKANPNGYTIGIHSFPAPIIKEYLFDTPYKSHNLSFICAWTMTPMLMFVAEGGWKTFDEFLVEARKRELNMGLPSLGSTSHLLVLGLAKQMNIKFTFIPYAGSREGFAALAGKHIDANIGSMDSALGMVRGKKVRPVLIWSFHSDPNFPDVPLSTKYNLPTIVTVRGVFGPPNIPEDRVRILEKAFSLAAADPKLAEWAKTGGIDLINLNAKSFREEIEKQEILIANFKDVLKSLK